MTEPLPRRLQVFSAQFDGHLNDYLQTTSDVPAKLLEAVRYSVLAPGKRLRPYLVVRCCELLGGSRAETWTVAGPIVLAGSEESGYHLANDVGYDGSSAA